MSESGTSPWARADEPVPLGDSSGLVMLVEGQAFCVSGRSGDITPGTPQGLFIADSRIVSSLRLSIDGEPLEPLGVAVDGSFGATMVGRIRPRAGRPQTDVLVLRRRYVGMGLREDIEVRNYGSESLSCPVVVEVDGDFADLFAVKEGRVSHEGRRSVEVDGDQVLIGWTLGEASRTAIIRFCGPNLSVEPHRATWANLVIEPHQVITLCFDVSLVVGDRPVISRLRCGESLDTASPVVRSRGWQESAPRVDCDFEPLENAVAQGVRDLGALRLFDPDDEGGLPVLAAGAPWFMTLFGRDSLLASWMALCADPNLALGVLRTLGRLQGTKEDDVTEEEPGRILHELRFDDAPDLGLHAGVPYFGSVDATPLYVVVLGELFRWGIGADDQAQLLTYADRAIEWIERYGDRDGDGYVEYERRTERGLANQGWKDSWDSIRNFDGGFASTPIALCEVQGYVYAAYRARAEMARRGGDMARSDDLEGRASQLKEQFNRDFWLEDRGIYALALDGAKQPVTSSCSNVGHCLWSGIIDAERAPAVARELLGPGLWSGWGIRTMESGAAAYNPMSYHCGSVWPHDNAIAVAGLVRYGLLEEAHTVVVSLLEAAGLVGNRLPELFCGLDRGDVHVPISYPTSCSPQAWASAVPLSFLRSLLRLEPYAPRRRLRMRPVLPEIITHLDVRGLHVGGGRVRVRVENGRPSLEGLPDGWAWEM